MYFVVSDVHGCYDQLKEALTHWNHKGEHLLVLGDLIDRGPKSLEVVQHLMKLKEKYPENVTVLKGNHEHMFTSWLMESPFELLAYYYNREHNETLRSFFESDKRYKKASRRQRAEHVLYKYKDELSFLNDLPYYYETDALVFVHAGFNLKFGDWHDDKKEMLWSRNFAYSSKPLDKKTFFGHTPTSFLHEDEDNFDVWTNDAGDRVCVDGGVSMNGQLNVLRVNTTGEVNETLVFK